MTIYEKDKPSYTGEALELHLRASNYFGKIFKKYRHLHPDEVFIILHAALYGQKVFSAVMRDETEPVKDCQHPPKQVEAHFNQAEDEIYYVCNLCGKRLREME